MTGFPIGARINVHIWTPFPNNIACFHYYLLTLESSMIFQHRLAILRTTYDQQDIYHFLHVDVFCCASQATNIHPESFLEVTVGLQPTTFDNFG